MAKVGADDAMLGDERRQAAVRRELQNPIEPFDELFAAFPLIGRGRGAHLAAEPCDRLDRRVRGRSLGVTPPGRIGGWW